MKNFIYSIILISVLSSVIFSCTKNTGPDSPVIVLTAPTDTTTINAGDTIKIQGYITDNKNLHEVYFTIQNNATNTVVVSDNPYTHGSKKFDFNYVWVAGDSSIYKLSIQALDHENHSSTKELLLNVN